MNEIKIMRSIKHHNLIKLHCFFETNTTFYLIFDLYCEGNLQEFVKKNGYLSECRAAKILISILEGVKHLHDKNIMHRDIKPSNILFKSLKIWEKDSVILADFGLATSNNVPEYIYFKCGTPGYIAPEIFKASSPQSHYSIKCDLFSIGVTLFYMLTGKLPYSNKKDILKELANTFFFRSEVDKALRYLRKQKLVEFEGDPRQYTSFTFH